MCLAASFRGGGGHPRSKRAPPGSLPQNCTQHLSPTLSELQLGLWASVLYLDVYHASVSKVCLKVLLLHFVPFQPNRRFGRDTTLGQQGACRLCYGSCSVPRHPHSSGSSSRLPPSPQVTRPSRALEDGLVAADLSPCSPSFLRLSSGSLGRNVLK